MLRCWHVLANVPVADLACRRHVQSIVTVPVCCSARKMKPSQLQQLQPQRYMKKGLQRRHSMI